MSGFHRMFTVKTLTRGLLSGAFVVLLSLNLVVPQALAETAPAPAAPQPTALKAGLAASYFIQLFTTVEQVQDWAETYDPFVGDPIHSLNYRSGEDDVLTSGQEDGVGAHITGFIRFDEPGTYSIAAQSNDGLSIDIGGVNVVYDPDVHADRYSQPVQIEIKTAGWYPLDAWYFERRNTSTLRLFWLLPDEEEGSMVVVPKAHYGH